MDFTSPLFIFLFLPIFLLIYLISTPKARLPILTVASIIFLTWGQTVALWWLGTLVIATYILGRGISFLKERGRRGTPLLWSGIIINLAILAFFKVLTTYGANSLAWSSLPESVISTVGGLVIPIGLSYVTFQAISYLVDIWRGNTPAETNFVRLTVYLLFFPKIVSGPLIRFKPFNDQIDNLAPSMDDVASGFRRIFAGFIKRTLLANQLALVANAVFRLPTPNIEPWFAWLGLIAYTLQIYFDFSGYTDIALGLGQMIGIRLPENFNFPYIAQSVSDFWRRWHISLTTWFREYVFFPLERRRFKWAGQQINILIVFFLTGLWHGFKPTFIIWGLLHGLAIVVESIGFGSWLKNVWQPVRHLYTLAIILLGWIFFRSTSLDFAFVFLRRLAGDVSDIHPLPFSQTTPLPFIEPSFLLVLTFGIIFSLPLSNLWVRLRTAWQDRQPVSFFGFQAMEDLFLIFLFVLGLAALVSSSFNPNIYAKF
jgi:alginate O-acetyltransferase complex protein AlgI